MFKNFSRLFTNKKFISQKYFSTLIVPEINGNRLNPSVNNLVTVALKLQSEVKINIYIS